MTKKSILLFSIAAALFLLFAAFTLALTRIDVAEITYTEGVTAAIGFAGLNRAVFSALGTNELWYTVTELLGLAAIAVAGAFALLGLYQLIKRRCLFAVDPAILLLACLYVLVLGFYVLFEVWEINFRPILIDGILEASYPSSHTMLALAVFGSAPIVLSHVFRRKAVTGTAIAICAILAAVIAAGRLLAGVHWLTDIVGALLLSSALVLLYAAALSCFDKGCCAKTE